MERHASTVLAAGHITNPFATSTKRSISLKLTAIDRSRTGRTSDGDWYMICLINYKCWSSMTFQFVTIHLVILSLYIFRTCFLNRKSSYSLSCWVSMANILVAAFQHCPPSINAATNRPVRSSYVSWVGPASNSEIRGISLEGRPLLKYCWIVSCISIPHTFYNWIASSIIAPLSASIFCSISNTDKSVWKTWTARPLTITFWPLIAPDFYTITSTSWIGVSEWVRYSPVTGGAVNFWRL